MSIDNLTVKFPLEITADDVGYKNITDVNEMIRYNLKSTLLTNPGELISNPNFGVGLKRFLFEQPTSNTMQNLRSRISSQVSAFLPYITVVKLGMAVDQQRNTLRIKINYKITNTQVVEIFELSTELPKI
jgi:phage baseplate assembly protein W